MSLAEDRLRALRFEGPELIPVSVGILPTAWMKYRRELDELVRRFPEVCAGHLQDDRDYEAAPATYMAGSHVDAWGCTWQNVHTGQESIVTGPRAGQMTVTSQSSRLTASATARTLIFNESEVTGMIIRIFTLPLPVCLIARPSTPSAHAARRPECGR